MANGRRCCLLMLGVLLGLIPVRGAAQAIVEMEFRHDGLVPGHWILTIHEEGSAHFWSEPGPASTERRSIEAAALDEDVVLSRGFVQRIFAVARSQQEFRLRCESRHPVAFQGQKTLRYRSATVNGSCVYNYSDIKAIESAGNEMQQVAETLVTGARLGQLAVHDRLGLDRAMEELASGFEEGRVSELGAIRPTLEKLAADPTVLERVRQRARALLQRTASERD